MNKKEKKLTVHVLDVATGESAAGIKVEVERVEGRVTIMCASTTTAKNGRSEPPLLVGNKFPPGSYRLHFYAGDYFAAQGIKLPEPRFLDQLTINIGVGEESIHIPLLITPWSYSVYRGC
jgi:5-hydroxyisourate hydrolase